MLVSLLSLFDDFHKTPAFVLADVSRLGDENGIAYSALVVFVVRLKLFGLVDGLFVERVFRLILDGDDDGLVYSGLNDYAYALFSVISLNDFCHFSVLR